ncbi:Septation initiation network scaffold protein [Yarrowia sp. C11]|nr:Septation initiation network scaffold protein [Yarrowia sp. C11]
MSDDDAGLVEMPNSSMLRQYDDEFRYDSGLNDTVSTAPPLFDHKSAGGTVNTRRASDSEPEFSHLTTSTVGTAAAVSQGMAQIGKGLHIAKVQNSGVNGHDSRAAEYEADNEEDHGSALGAESAGGGLESAPWLEELQDEWPEISNEGWEDEDTSNERAERERVSSVQSTGSVLASTTKQSSSVKANTPAWKQMLNEESKRETNRTLQRIFLPPTIGKRVDLGVIAEHTETEDTNTQGGRTPTDEQYSEGGSITDQMAQLSLTKTPELGPKESPSRSKSASPLKLFSKHDTYTHSRFEGLLPQLEGDSSSSGVDHSSFDSNRFASDQSYSQQQMKMGPRQNQPSESQDYLNNADDLFNRLKQANIAQFEPNESEYDESSDWDSHRDSLNRSLNGRSSQQDVRSTSSYQHSRGNSQDLHSQEGPVQAYFNSVKQRHEVGNDNLGSIKTFDFGADKFEAGVGAGHTEQSNAVMMGSSPPDLNPQEPLSLPKTRPPQTLSSKPSQNTFSSGFSVTSDKMASVHTTATATMRGMGLKKKASLQDLESIVSAIGREKMVPVGSDRSRPGKKSMMGFISKGEVESLLQDRVGQMDYDTNQGRWVRRGEVDTSDDRIMPLRNVDEEDEDTSNALDDTDEVDGSESEDPFAGIDDLSVSEEIPPPFSSTENPEEVLARFAESTRDRPNANANVRISSSGVQTETNPEGLIQFGHATTVPPRYEPASNQTVKSAKEGRAETAATMRAYEQQRKEDRSILEMAQTQTGRSPQRIASKAREVAHSPRHTNTKKLRQQSPMTSDFTEGSEASPSSSVLYHGRDDEEEEAQFGGLDGEVQQEGGFNIFDVDADMDNSGLGAAGDDSQQYNSHISISKQAAFQSFLRRDGKEGPSMYGKLEDFDQSSLSSISHSMQTSTPDMNFSKVSYSYPKSTLNSLRKGLAATPGILTPPSVGRVPGKHISLKSALGNRTLDKGKEKESELSLASLRPQSAFSSDSSAGALVEVSEESETSGNVGAILLNRENSNSSNSTFPSVNNSIIGDFHLPSEGQHNSVYMDQSKTSFKLGNVAAKKGINKQHERDLEGTHGPGNSVATQALVKSLQELNPREQAWHKVRHLDIKGRGLVSLQDLNRICRSLTDLRAAENKLTNLAGISTQLRVLKLSHNLLEKTVSFLDFKNLQELDLSHNPSIGSLSSLRHLNSLRVLNVDNCGLDSLEPLSKLEGLMHLSANYNHLANTLNLDEYRWPSMEQLYLNHNELVAVYGVETLHNLLILGLNNNYLTRFKPGAPLATVNGIAVGISKLSLANNVERPRLRRLMVSGNKLVDLDISLCSRLMVCKAEHNQLDRVKGIEHCPELITLSLGGQRVPIGNLDSANDVRDLLLVGTKIVDFPLCTPFMNLNRLDLSNCNLKSLPANFACLCMNVRVLNLNFNEIEDLTPLMVIPKLTHLFLVGNRIPKDSKSLRMLISELGFLRALDTRNNPETEEFYPDLMSVMGTQAVNGKSVSIQYTNTQTAEFEKAWQETDAKFVRNLKAHDRETYEDRILYQTQAMLRVHNKGGLLAWMDGVLLGKDPKYLDSYKKHAAKCWAAREKRRKQEDADCRAGSSRGTEFRAGSSRDSSMASV